MSSGTFAKTVLLSCFLTTCMIFGVLIIARDWIKTEVLELPAASVAGTGVANAAIMNGTAIPDMIERVNPAVVSVIASKDVPVYERYFEEFNPFGGVFGGITVPRVRERGTEVQEVAGGSGFIVTADGLVVTNRHVVSDEAARYTVVLSNGETRAADILARDEVLDIAILKIAGETETYPFLQFGDSDRLRLGEPVVVIGNALSEFQNTVSVGIVSGLSRTVVAGDMFGRSEQLDAVIQTDAAINPGNSGGPLLTIAGEVVGVSVAASLGAENIGFALPGNAVASVVRSVIDHGEIRRPYLGVHYRTVTPAVAAEFDLPVSYGALVIGNVNDGTPAVLPDSPAAQAGLREFDVIVSVDGEGLEGRELAAVLRQQEIGQAINLKVYRDNQEITVPVTLEAAPTS